MVLGHSVKYRYNVYWACFGWSLIRGITAIRMSLAHQMTSDLVVLLQLLFVSFPLPLFADIDSEAPALRLSTGQQCCSIRPRPRCQ